MSSQVAECKDAGLGVEDQLQLQANTTFEQTAAQAANPKSRMEVRSAEAIANRGDDLADLLPLPFWKAANCRLQFGRELNA